MDLSTRILLIGNSNFEIYASAFYNAWIELGYCNVQFFETNKVLDKLMSTKSIVRRAEEKLAWGMGIASLNLQLKQQICIQNPQLIFIYSSRFIYPSIIKKCRRQGIIVFGYNNDNPFSDYYPKYFWRLYIRNLKYMNLIFVYRTENLIDCQKKGYENARLLRSYYIEGMNFIDNNPDIEEKVPDIIFLGHYENDKRVEYIQHIIDSDISIGLLDEIARKLVHNLDNVIVLKKTRGLFYNKKISQTKIALVFLSTLNHDTYTRRCFEIPAAGTMMLSEYTDDLASMFEEDKEIVFFRSKEELVDKIKYYLSHDEEREQIAKAGRERVLKDGHEVKDRVMQVMKEYYKLVNEEE